VAVSEVEARIRPDNAASIKAFLAADFDPVEAHDRSKVRLVRKYRSS
jgi:RimJ/RimL family protein N-acetyltransferase